MQASVPRCGLPICSSKPHLTARGRRLAHPETRSHHAQEMDIDHQRFCVDQRPILRGSTGQLTARPFRCGEPPRPAGRIVACRRAASRKPQQALAKRHPAKRVLKWRVRYIVM